jgi:hypothetical protein
LNHLPHDPIDNVAIVPPLIAPVNQDPNNPLGQVDLANQHILEDDLMDLPDQEIIDAKTFFPAVNQAILDSKLLSASPQTHRLTVTPGAEIADDQVIVLPRLVDPSSFDSLIPRLETLMRVIQCEPQALIFTAEVISYGYKIQDDYYPQMLPTAIPSSALFRKADFPFLFTLSKHAVSIMNIAKREFLFQTFAPAHYNGNATSLAPSAKAILDTIIAPEPTVQAHANKNIEALLKSKTAGVVNTQVLQFNIFSSLCNNNHEHANTLVDQNTDITNDLVTSCLLRSRNKMSLMSELAIHSISGALTQVCTANCTEHGTWNGKNKPLSFCLHFFAPTWVFNKEICFDTLRNCTKLVDAITSMIKFIVTILNLDVLKDTEPDLLFFWNHLFDATITILQDRNDFNISLLSPKQRNFYVFQTIVDVFAFIRKPANQKLNPMEKLRACRDIQLKYKGETQHGMANYFNQNAIIPQIPIINLEGKTIGHSENAPAYLNQDKKPFLKDNQRDVGLKGGGAGNRGNNYRDDRDRDRYLRENDNKNNKRHDYRERDRSRDRNNNNNKENDNRYNNSDRDLRGNNNNNNNNNNNEDNKNDDDIICMDHLGFVLHIPGRNCRYGKTCRRDHDFSRMPLRQSTKNKAIEQLKTERYSGKLVSESQKKFKADVLKAIGK